jgi:predicted phosphoadenosine phosphosulfate sulfurtransferase
MSDEGFSGDDIVTPDIDRASLSTGKIAKKQAIDRSVLDLARERIDEAFKLFDTVAVSFSGGKDSTVCLHLALDAAQARGKNLIVFHYDEEAIPLETEDYVRRVAAMPGLEMRWYCVPIQHRNACTRKQPYWYPWAPEDEAKWVRPLPPEAITFDMVPGFPSEISKRPTMPDSVPLLFEALDYGRTAMVMGIRADESLTRTRAILMRHSDTRPYIRPWAENLFKVYPIYDWSTADVWTAPAQFGWDHNAAYDVMEYAGISHNDQRCAPPYGEEPMRGLWTFAVCFPEIWDKMSRRVPGAATAARYSTTELYAYGGIPEKPAGMSWPAFVRQWIEKHPQPYRGEIAARVKRWIDGHYDKTTEVIAPRAPHPVTGISWQFLMVIAMRGDYKDRKQPGMHGQTVARARERYEKELAQTPFTELVA